MKISAAQFARLTHLLAKGDALSDEEKTEKAAIESQIVAAEDEGEKEGEGEEEKETTDPEPEPEPEPEPQSDPAPTADPVDDEKAFARLTMGDKFRALIASRAGLLTKLHAANARITALGDQLAAATARADQAESALATATADLSASKARVATLESEAKDINTAVTDELAGIGLDRKELVATDPQGKGGDLEAAYEDFRAAKTPEDKAAAHRRLKALQAKKQGAKETALN